MFLLKNRIFIFFIVMILLMPQFWGRIPQIELLVNISRPFIFIFLSVIYLKGKKISPFILGIFLFVIIRVLITVYYNGFLNLVVYHSIPQISICLLGEILLKRKELNYIKILSFFLSVIILINLITIIVYPYGLYLDGTIPSYFLGNRNSLARIIIPALGVICFSSIYYNRKLTISFFLVLFCSILTSVLILSSTLLITMLLLLFTILVMYRKKITYFISYNKMMISYIILFISITLFNLQNLFSFFIEGYLGKSITLSDRTIIWQEAYKMIGKSILIGYGAIKGATYVEILGGIRYSAHNFFLQLLLETGLLGFTTFLVLLILVGMRMKKVRKNKLSIIIVIFVAFTFITYLTEAHYDITVFFILLSFGNNIKQITLNCLRRE